METNDAMTPISRHYRIETIGIVGTGAMGRGIAQIAALAGLKVRLFDTNAPAVGAARDYLVDTFANLTAKGKLDEVAARTALAAVSGAQALADFADCDLVVEAIVEKLDAKRALFRELETIVSGRCVLASNTSSLSITAIAAGCTDPSRVAGYHFFNPVPLMKVVEVIDGLRTDPAAGDALMDLARRMGHTPVRAKDMPGFIVNHAGRGMNTEGLRIADEGVASFVDVDRIMREQAGFRLGPFELLDLTALDVSHPVMESIYHQFYEEPRFKPSSITATRLAGGLIGRKTDEGFYRYVDGKQQVPPEPPAPTALPPRVWISKRHAQAHDAVQALVAKAGVPLDTGATPTADALIAVTPFGLDATTAALDEQLDATRVVAVDALFPLVGTQRRTLMTTPATTRTARDTAHALFAADGVPVTVIRDSAGFVAQRVVATIVNIGCEIAQRQIATPQDIDLAVTLGLGYPRGPLALGDALGANTILAILRNMYTVLGDPRYRVSPWLARRAQLGLSLTQTDAADANDTDTSHSQEPSQ
jgi:3-hydroxybutyryl-CoA dehydrogenase